MKPGLTGNESRTTRKSMDETVVTGKSHHWPEAGREGQREEEADQDVCRSIRSG